MQRPLLDASSPLSVTHRVLEPRRKSVSNDVNSQASRTVLTPGEWLRAVSDVRAPFGFDRMPTVWG